MSLGNKLVSCSVQAMYESIWECMRVYEGIWEYIRIHKNIWEYIRIHKNILKYGIIIKLALCYIYDALSSQVSGVVLKASFPYTHTHTCTDTTLLYLSDDFLSHSLSGSKSDSLYNKQI